MPQTNVFDTRILLVFLSNLGTEVLFFLVSEFVVRFIIPSTTRRTERLKLLVLQGCIVAAATLFLHVFHHRPILLVIVIISIFIRFLSIYSDTATGESPHTHVSKPLRKSMSSPSAVPMQWVRLWGDAASSRDTHQPVDIPGNDARSQQLTVLTHKLKPQTSTNVNAITGCAPLSNNQDALRVKASSDQLSQSPLKRSFVPVSHHETKFAYPGHSYLQYVASFWDHKKPSDCPPGISNLGNACFINSPLQALAWTPGFTEALEAKCTTKVAKTSPASAKVKLLKALHSVLDSCRAVPDGSSIFGAVSSASFVRRVSELVPGVVAPPHHAQYQQDASEFLLWLLDNLEGDGKNINSDDSSEVAQRKEIFLQQLCNTKSYELSNPIEAFTALATDDWTLESSKSSYMTRTFFLGQMLEVRECQNCCKISVNVEYYTVLPLPIPESSPGKLSLSDCFARFSTRESLSDSNMMVCSCMSGDKDGEMTLMPGVRVTMLSRLPQRLIIQLCRFSYDRELRSAKKNATPISLPTSIDIAPFLMESKLSSNGISKKLEMVMYTLYAVCIHTGAQSTSYGHYVAYCRVSNGKWYSFNDSNVSEVADIEQELQKAVLLQNAYLLFYSAADID